MLFIVFEDIDDVVYAWEKMFNSALDDHCPWRESNTPLSSPG